MTIALLNTVIFTPVTLIVRVSDRRDFIPQGALSYGNAIDQNGRFCPCRQRYHQDLSFPFASSFLQRTDSSIPLTMSDWSGPISSRNSIRSEPDHLVQRSQVDTESLVAAFRKRWITNMIIE